MIITKNEVRSENPMNHNEVKELLLQLAPYVAVITEVYIYIDENNKLHITGK